MSGSSKQMKRSKLSSSKLGRGTSGLLNQSRIRRKGSSSNVSKSRSGTKLLNSRFMSRMKGSTYGKSGFRKKGSSKYSTFREEGDPKIFRNGIDVTPLSIQVGNVIVPKPTSTYSSEYEANKTEEYNCFIPLSEAILHPLSMTVDQDDKKELEKVVSSQSANDRDSELLNEENNKTVICTDRDSAIETMTDLDEINQFIQSRPHLLEENIVINLCESETKILFEMPALAVSNNETSNEERERVIKSNEDYDNCVLKHSDQDSFTSSYTQTYNPPVKEQSISVQPPKTSEQTTQSSKFDIRDSFKKNSSDKVTPRTSMSTQTQTFPQYVEMTQHIKEKMESSASFKKNLKTMERAVIQTVMAEQQMLFRIHANSDQKDGNEFDSDDELVSDKEHSSTTKAPLKVEIDLNIIDPTEEKVEEEEEKEEEINRISMASLGRTESMMSNIPHLQPLWTFSCNASNGLACTAMDFNPLNTDLIAGGYGSWQFGNKENGKIMFWTLKNPTNPSRIYNIDGTCVVSLNFSRTVPHLLSVGLYDGSVAVYDVRLQSSNPILKSQLNSGIADSKKQNASSSSKHTTPVWNVLWERPKQKAILKSLNDDGSVHNIPSSKLHQQQKLFSIASDGLIKQWSMKKGFMSTNIMSLKRVPNLAAKRGSVIDNTIRSRQASGLCFDFPLNSNNSQYYVGTEDGIVHKCSVSYNEQVLRTYYGHNGPVYRVQCSPFDNSKFLTCSADWTLNVWSENESSPLLQLNSTSNEAVIDCCWSPFDSCVLASASEKGILSVWNLEKNKKDAIITKDTKHPIKQIMFAPNAPALLSAQSNGDIQVYRLNNMKTNRVTKSTTDLSNNDTSQVCRLDKALKPEN